MQDKIEQLKSITSQTMKDKPINREDVKKMLASIDPNMLSKYTGKNTPPTEEELSFIYKFLGI